MTSNDPSPSNKRGQQRQASSFSSSSSSSSKSKRMLYRADGVRINYDPYSREMTGKYGKPGETDDEGFNPYADTVGPGIYGGRVQRDEQGGVIIGEQYQGHNPRPGPLYAGGGYSEMVKAIKVGREEVIQAILDDQPEAINEITTGGATPLHMCGMSSVNQMMTAFLISKGADIEAVDTYGYRPLHRMASNNLAIGAEALLQVGADPRAETRDGVGETAWEIARDARANDVLSVLLKYLQRPQERAD